MTAIRTLLTATLLTAALFAQEHAAPDPTSGTPDSLIAPAKRQPAPDFTITDLQGHPVTLSKLRGKVVLLDFWATWCGGCKVELPWYVDFDKKYRDKGLVVLGVSMDDGPGVVKTFVAQKGLNYPIVMGTEALGDEFHLQSMPLTLLIDKSGRIAVSHSGIVNRANFEDHIQTLLR